MKKETNSESKDRQFDWFYMMPYDIEEIIQHCGLSVTRWKEYAMDYLSIMKTFNRKKTKQHGDIRLSVLRKAMYLKNYKVFDSIIDCKWLFYKYPVGEYRKDFIIQPIFDTSRLTPLQYSQAVEALRDSNYQELTRIIPFRVRPELKKQELLDYDTNGDATASIPNTTSFSYVLSSKEGSGREAAAPQTESVKITNYPDSNPDSDHESNLESNPESNTESNPESNTESNLESSPRNNMYACLDKKQETRDKKIKELSSSKTMKTKKISSSSSDENNFSLFSRERALDDCLAEMDVGSFEAQEILAKCAAHRQFYTDNFKLLKLAFRNWCVLKSKPDKCTPEDIRTYFAYVMASPRMEKLIFDDVEQKQRSSSSKLRVGIVPGFPFDLYNVKGQRVSEGVIVPEHAPPKPGADFWWNNDHWEGM